jgi:oxygen-independent coproporphyrinogen-3 oxidase
MIKVYTNRENFQYDLHSLIKAFYPECEVRVYGEDVVENEDGGDDHITVRFYDDDAYKMETVFVISGNAKIYADEYKCGVETAKNEYKLSLYRNLCDYTGKTLPWGNLTGIRPTKLPMAMLGEGMSDGEIIKSLQAAHMVSDEKARLSLDIAKREMVILDNINYKDGYSLYIGIPFCPTTCLYCSFTSYPIAVWRKRIGEYLEALFKEIDFISEFYRDKILDTVYIGGGTPTTLEPCELEDLLGYVREKLDFSNVKEFTVEAGRADSITREKLEVLKKYGVTRISVNPQTMKDETLRLIGRRHTVEQVRTAFALARETGFDNINMDIILGLPGETPDDVQHTIDEITKLNPDSLTVHSLAVKRASKLGEWIEQNGISTIRNTDDTMEIARQGALSLGMEPYYLYRQKNMSGNFENVGYAREGKFGIYNILIMEEIQTIIALGAGSITKRVFPDGRIERCDNVKDVALYIERIDEMVDRKRRLLGDL